MSTPTLQPEVRADVTTTNEPARSPGPGGPLTAQPAALLADRAGAGRDGARARAARHRRAGRSPSRSSTLFTFHELFGAPWNGLENYRSILLDTDNPLHAGFWGAVSNTVVYTFWTVTGTLIGGLADRAAAATARCPASAWRGR